jgi:Tfp pilus assembly protein PilF
MAESSPTAAVPHVNLTFVQLPRGEIASANEHLREAVRLAPGNPRAQAGLGLTETLLGHLDVGLRHGLRARELAPDSADVLASLGALYLARGEPARAVPELSASLRFKPNQVHAALNLALAWLEPEAAEDQLEATLVLVRLISPGLPLADRTTAEIAAGRDSARSRAARARYVARLQAGGQLSPALAADLDRAERRLGKVSVAYPEPIVSPPGRMIIGGDVGPGAVASRTRRSSAAPRSVFCSVTASMTPIRSPRRTSRRWRGTAGCRQGCGPGTAYRRRNPSGA